MDKITVVGIKGPVVFRIGQMIDINGVWFSVYSVSDFDGVKRVGLEVSDFDEQECKKRFMAGETHDGISEVGAT